MRKQLSQQKLLEILCHEIDMLQETSKNIKEVAPEIGRKLHEQKTTKLKFDLNTNKLEELLEKYKHELQKNMVFPKRFLWMVVSVLIISVINLILQL